MLRLTFLLCAAIFLTLLVGGRDYGQTRPGLADADPPSPQPIIQPVEVASLEPRPEISLLQAVAQPVAALPVTPAPPPVRVAEPEPEVPVVYVTARSVNVRSGPSTDHPVIGKLARGEAALLVGSDTDGWAPIRIEGDGIEGFVSAAFLSPDEPLRD